MYSYEIVHRPGRLHGNADPLSRIMCSQCGGNHASEKIRKDPRPVVANSEGVDGERAKPLHPAASGITIKV